MADEQAPTYLDGVGRRQTADGVFIVGSDHAASVISVPVVHMNGVTVAGAGEILPSDPDRFALTLRNSSDTQMRMRVDDAEAGPTDYPLDPGRGYEFPENMVPSGAVSIYCTVADKTWNMMIGTRADA